MTRSEQTAPSESVGVAMRAFLTALLLWPAWAIFVSFGACMLWGLVLYAFGKGSGLDIALFGALACAVSGFALWCARTAYGDLREKWARVHQVRDQGPIEGSALVGAQVMATPWGSVGQLLLVVYLFTLHPLWLERLQGTSEVAGVDWLTLLLVLVAIGLEHWGCDGLLRSLPVRVSGRMAGGVMAWGLLFMCRAGFLTTFLAGGLAGFLSSSPVNISGRTALVGFFGCMLILAKEAWLFLRIGSRSQDAQMPPLLLESAHWLGTLAFYGMVEFLLFHDAPLNQQEGGWAGVLPLTVFVFTPFWTALQFPHLVRHFSARTTLRQELAWWGSTLAVYVAVAHRLWAG